MSDDDRPRCHYAGDDRPRMLRTHLADCADATCDGCAPCPERHCVVCGRTHLDGEPLTCPGCIQDVRLGLKRLVYLAEWVGTEAEHRGVDSTAAVLAGPVADPERWGHVEASVLCGRLPRMWQDAADDEAHPLWVLGTWEMVVRDHLDQPCDDAVRVDRAAGYLDLQVRMLAQDPYFAFADMRRDVLRSVGYVEDVLREGEREQRGAPCPACGDARLVKHWGATEDDDRWTCPRCAQWWSQEDYRAKVEGTYVQVAGRLTASQIASTYRVAEGTVRQWAARGQVAKRGRDWQGRMLYDVADVLRTRDGGEDALESVTEAGVGVRQSGLHSSYSAAE